MELLRRTLCGSDHGMSGEEVGGGYVCSLALEWRTGSLAIVQSSQSVLSTVHPDCKQPDVAEAV
jgi:hypothetical protein